MLTCDAARDELALDPTTEQNAVQTHLASCPACAAYARHSAALDGLMRTELRWEAPPDLTAKLLAMAFSPVMMVAPPKPKRWHVVLATVATVASLLLSALIIWQVVSLINAEFDIVAQLSQLWVLPSQWLARITQQMPESRYLIDLLFRIRTQLIWLLFAALVWALLDRWSPQLPTFRRQNTV